MGSERQLLFIELKSSHIHFQEKIIAKQPSLNIHGSSHQLTFRVKMVSMKKQLIQLGAVTVTQCSNHRTSVCSSSALCLLSFLQVLRASEIDHCYCIILLLLQVCDSGAQKHLDHFQAWPLDSSSRSSSMLFLSG